MLIKQSDIFTCIF